MPSINKAIRYKCINIFIFLASPLFSLAFAQDASDKFKQQVEITDSIINENRVFYCGNEVVAIYKNNIYFAQSNNSFRIIRQKLRENYGEYDPHRFEGSHQVCYEKYEPLIWRKSPYVFGRNIYSTIDSPRRDFLESDPNNADKPTLFTDVLSAQGAHRIACTSVKKCK